MTDLIDREKYERELETAVSVPAQWLCNALDVLQALETRVAELEEENWRLVHQVQQVTRVTG